MPVSGTSLELEDFFGGLAIDLETKFASDTAATNIVDFLENEVDKEAWGIELTKRQLLILKCFYGETLDEEDIQILDAWQSLDRTSFLLDLYEEQGPKRRQALIVEAGRRSGKSMIGSIIIGFEFYKLCMLPSPQLHYGIAASTPIAIYCLATGADQTKKTIYGQARAFLEFIPKVKRLIDQKKIIIGETEVKYRDKLIYIYSGNSKSSSQVGSSVILLLMDEVARFKSDNGESNALELWSNLGVSGVTFGEDALRVAISSAWEDKDAIQVLYNICKDPEVADTFVGFRLRSWDANPKHASRDSPIIRAEYASNPISAALEFEGVRTSGQYAFLNKEEVIRAFKGANTVKATKLPASEDRLVKLHITEVTPAKGLRTYLHLDPAVKKDAYGMAYGHKDTNAEGQTIVVIDGLLAWEPDELNQVSITNVQQAIYDINKYRPLAKITSDHQHSPETIQRLKANGFNAETIYFSRSMQMDMFDCLRKLLHEDRLILPRFSDYSYILKDELINLQLLKENKIDHKPDGSKDLADCVAAICWQLVGNEIQASGPTITLKLPKAITSPGTTDLSSFRKQLKSTKTRWGGFGNDNAMSAFSADYVS